MQALDLDILVIRDLHGCIREISGLPLGKRRRFRKLQTFALYRLSQQQKLADELYDSDDFFKYAVDGCLECFGLDPEAFNFSLVVSLVLFRVIDGKRVPGLLVELEFPSVKDAGEPLDEDVDPDLYNLAIAWLANGGSLGEIVRDCGGCPLSFNEVKEVVRQRGLILEKSQAAAKEEASKASKKPGPSQEIMDEAVASVKLHRQTEAGDEEVSVSDEEIKELCLL